MNNKGFTAVELLVFITCVLVFLLIVCLPFIGPYVRYSSGKRVGELIKFSQRGILVPNQCGELSIGGQGQAGYVFDFGIDRTKDDQILITKLNAYVGKQVEVTYDQRLGANPFVSCDPYIVTDIKEIK